MNQGFFDVWEAVDFWMQSFVDFLLDFFWSVVSAVMPLIGFAIVLAIVVKTINTFR